MIVLSLPAVLGFGVAAGESADPGSTTITLPPGVAVPPGTYPVTLAVPDGSEVVATVVVAGEPVAPTSEQPLSGVATSSGGVENAGTTDGGGGFGVLVAILATLAVVGVGLLVHRLVVVPRRSSRDYTGAVALFAKHDYRRALPALTRIETTLPERLRRRARFYIAFALVRLDEFDEAEHRLAAVHREDPADVDVAYLLAYVRATRRDYDGAEPPLAALEKAGGLTSGRARKLYGLVQYHRAVVAVRTGRIDAAAELFGQVERLGDYVDRVPADLRNHHVVLGARALFDKDVVGARRQFEGLELAVPSLPESEREVMAALADLGLALAAWIENAPGGADRVETLLVSAARRLRPDGAVEAEWPDPSAEPSIADRVGELNEQGEAAGGHEHDRVLRDIHLLRGVARLRAWAVNPHDRTRERLAGVVSGFALVRQADSDFSDPYLVVGLLRYHFAEDDQERSAAVRVLARARALGARDPELLRVLNQHAQLVRASRNVVGSYLQVLDQFVEDGSISEQVRATLVGQLSRFGKVRSWDQRPELRRVHVSAPSVAEMNDRSRLLRERIDQLLAVRRDDPRLAAAGELTRSLEDDSQVLLDHARAVERKEAEVLAIVGDQLLSENEVTS